MMTINDLISIALWFGLGLIVAYTFLIAGFFGWLSICRRRGRGKA